MKNTKLILIRIYLTAIFLTGLITGAHLNWRYHTTGRPLSLVLLGITMLVVLTSAALLIISAYRPAWIVEGASRGIAGNRGIVLKVILGLLVLEIGGDFLFLKADLNIFAYRKYQELLSAYFSTAAAVFTLSSLGLIGLAYAGIWSRRGSHRTTGLSDPVLKWGFMIFGMFLLIWVLILARGLGYSPNSGAEGNFQPAPAPLAGIQVGLVVLVLWMIWRLAAWIKGRLPGSLPWWIWDLLLVLILWVAAYTLWGQVPLKANYFLDGPWTPGQQYFPLSDSLYYEREAQAWLVGNGFSPFAEHPLYLFFLGVLHAVEGDSLLEVIRLQLAVLALIPAGLYWVGKSLFNRQSGLLAAGLLLIRQRNRLLLMEHVNGTTVKMIMTEMLAVLCLLVVVIAALRWFKGSRSGHLYALLTGGAVGFSLLVRMEFLAVIPVLILAAVVFYQGQARRGWRSLAVAGCGLLLVITPWMVRNFLKTGEVYLDKYFAFQVLKERVVVPFSPDSELTPGEQTLEGSTVPARDMFGDWAQHAANNFTQVFLTLPNNHQPLFSFWSVIRPDRQPGQSLLAKEGLFSEGYLYTYVRGLPYTWPDWEGGLEPRSVVPVMAVTFLVSLGISASGRKNLPGTIILVTAAAFVLGGYALYSSSGGRFIQLVDWIPLFYLAVGLNWAADRLQILDGSTLVGGTRAPRGWAARSLDQPGAVWAGVVLLFAAGLVLPLSEVVLPKRYTVESLESLVADLPTLSQEFSLENKPASGEPRGEELVYGKALYPRYFPAGEKMEDDRQATTPDYRFSRMEFLMVGMVNDWVVVPVDAPIPIPHGVDVILSAVRVEAQQEDGIVRFGGYLHADRVFILQPADR